jgi:hypothetical protein
MLMPWVLARYVFVMPQTRKLTYRQGAGYLWAAAVLFVAAFFVPAIPISNETDTFSQHLVRGGVVGGLLFWYAVYVYRVRFSRWWQEPLALFFFVSGLGVANELLELFVTKAGITNTDGSDVWWDLLANTCGAALTLAVVYLARYLKHL